MKNFFRILFTIENFWPQNFLCRKISGVKIFKTPFFCVQVFFDRKIFGSKISERNFLTVNVAERVLIEKNEEARHYFSGSDQ
jgi:hypothetical protein